MRRGEVDVAAQDAERAHALLADAERRCIVSSSLKVPVVVQSVVAIVPAGAPVQQTA